jgi:hypothetical protein
MSLSVGEIVILACGCLVPIVVVVGVVVVLLLVLRRGKPKDVPQKTAAPRPASAPKAGAAAVPKAEATPLSKAVTMSDVAMKSCSSCGADNPADNAFCEYCGASLAEE